LPIKLLSSKLPGDRPFLLWSCLPVLHSSKGFQLLVIHQQ
jgi:hypothetical protein